MYASWPVVHILAQNMAVLVALLSYTIMISAYLGVLRSILLPLLQTGVDDSAAGRGRGRG